MLKTILPILLLLAAVAPCVAASPPPDENLLQRIEFRDASLQDAIRLLSDQTGLNIVCSSDAAKAKVSLFLQNVPARVAVEELCKAYNLSYRLDSSSGILRISTVEEFQRNLTNFRDQETRVFTLLYPNAVVVAEAVRDLFGDRVVLSLGSQNSDDELQDLQGRFSRFDLVDQRSQGLGASGTSPSGGGISGSTNSAYSGGFSNRSASNQQYNNRNNIQTTDAGEDMRPLTPDQADRLARSLDTNPAAQDQQALLDAYRHRHANIYVTVIRRNNNIVVRTSDPQTMDEIAKLVDRLDVPTPLVMLEVKVLAIDLSDSLNSAFDFQFSNGAGVASDFTSGNILPPPSDLLTGAAQRNASMLPGGTGLQANNLVFQVVSDDFRARLQALQSNNRVTQLAAPLLLTANNEVSRLFVGEEYPVIQNISSQTIVNNNTTTTAPNTTVNFQPVGTTLLLTPSINADRTVTLRILQENSQILPGAATIPVVTSTGSIQSQQVDVVSTRTFSGTVIAKDSLTLAVGGLISEQITDQRSEVPILGRIPLLGVLFQRKTTARTRTEFVIMIRPYILNTPAESQAMSQKLMQDLSIHPNAEHFDGTMNTFTPGEVPRHHPSSTQPSGRDFRFHSIEPVDVDY